MADSRRPLLVFDTNILMDVWLGRGGDQSVLLVGLAEQGTVELVVPEYVLMEFRGRASRSIRDSRSKLDQQVRSVANEWARGQKLGAGAEAIRVGARKVENDLAELEGKIDELVQDIRAVARVTDHTQDVHLRGELRYLAGHPPDRPGEGLHDCRIYEAILEIGRGDHGESRPRFVVTADGGFDDPKLAAELRGLGLEVRNDPGRLYGELRPKPSTEPDPPPTK